MRLSFSAFLVLALALLVILGCATTPVGLRVDTKTPGYTYNPSFNLKPVVQNVPPFRWEYTIKKIGEGRFRIEGTGEYIGSATWTQITGGSFALVLVDIDTITEYVGLPIMWTDLQRDVSFSCEFECERFTDTMIYYSLMVRG